MLVRMLVELSGSGYFLAPGDERDFPDAEAIRLIAAEYAVPVAEQKIERAVDASLMEARAPHGKRGKHRREA